MCVCALSCLGVFDIYQCPREGEGEVGGGGVEGCDTKERGRETCSGEVKQHSPQLELISPTSAPPPVCMCFAAEQHSTRPCHPEHGSNLFPVKNVLPMDTFPIGLHYTFILRQQ